MKWKKLFTKPISVVIFRIYQELNLRKFYYLKLWPKLQRSIYNWWADTTYTLKPVVFDPNALSALEHISSQKQSEIIAAADKVKNRNFTIFDVAIVPDCWTWHSDWRFGVCWPQKYFRHYNFYKKRQQPYDIKFPWELSRLGFLPVLLQSALWQDKKMATAKVLEICKDWEEQNPLAHSIAWYPMEASIRSIYLVFVLDMFVLFGEKKCTPLLRLLTMHGHFIWNTREYTDIRGNHYTANIVALLLLGLTLKDSYPQAKKWLKFATKAIDKEIAKQFFTLDGVNIEKSISYHRLVTELFIIAAIALKRYNMPLTSKAHNILHQACFYTAMYMRPDKIAPNVGDNDDATIFCCDLLSPQNHTNLLAVAAIFFEDKRLKPKILEPSISSLWLFGKDSLEFWKSPGCVLPEWKYFQNGGVVIAKTEQNYLWMDIGEVGMHGRGGHGHNDLTSFEFFSKGVPVIVDPGSYVYTADPIARNQFRSTCYHNVVCIDKKEMADLQGMWGIANTATPCDIKVYQSGQTLFIKAGHTGYKPISYHREVQFQLDCGALKIEDVFYCNNSHIVERFFHFAVGIKVILEEQKAKMSSDEKQWKMIWGKDTKARLEEGKVSSGYAQSSSAQVLVLENHVHKESQIFVEVYS